MVNLIKAKKYSMNKKVQVKILSPPNHICLLWCLNKNAARLLNSLLIFIFFYNKLKQLPLKEKNKLEITLNAKWHISVWLSLTKRLYLANLFFN